jgi:type IV pilus assembly protein PilE
MRRMVSFHEWNKRMRAYTMIELLIVVTVFVILAVIAYPSYVAYMHKSHRSEAKAILMETAQFMERHYTTNNTYVGASITSLSPVSPKGAKGKHVRYNIRFANDPSELTYTLQAIPANDQTADSCGTLSINQLGATTPSISGCW